MSEQILYYIIGGAGLLFLLAFFFKPIRLLLRSAIQTIGGGIFLYIFNFVGHFIGLNLSVNLLNACLVGLLGIPGFATAMVLAWIYP